MCVCLGGVTIQVQRTDNNVVILVRKKGDRQATMFRDPTMQSGTFSGETVHRALSRLCAHERARISAGSGCCCNLSSVFDLFERDGDSVTLARVYPDGRTRRKEQPEIRQPDSRRPPLGTTCLDRHNELHLPPDHIGKPPPVPLALLPPPLLIRLLVPLLQPQLLSNIVPPQQHRELCIRPGRIRLRSDTNASTAERRRRPARLAIHRSRCPVSFKVFDVATSTVRGAREAGSSPRACGLVQAVLKRVQDGCIRRCCRCA